MIQYKTGGRAQWKCFFSPHSTLSPSCPLCFSEKISSDDIKRSILHRRRRIWPVCSNGWGLQITCLIAPFFLCLPFLFGAVRPCVTRVRPLQNAILKVCCEKQTHMDTGTRRNTWRSVRSWRWSELVVWMHAVFSYRDWNWVSALLRNSVMTVCTHRNRWICWGRGSRCNITSCSSILSP